MSLSTGFCSICILAEKNISVEGSTTALKVRALEFWNSRKVSTADVSPLCLLLESCYF